MTRSPARPVPAPPDVAAPDEPYADTTVGPPRPPTGWRRLTSGRRWGRHGIELAVGAGLFLVSRVLLDERKDVVSGWEVDLFRMVNDLPDALRWPLWPVMQLGNFWMVSVGAVIAYLVTKRVAPALAVATAVLSAWILAKFIKRLLERGRPAELLDDVHLRESGIHGRGYVSGHVAIAFAVATVLTPLLPGRWRYVPFTLAAGVGFARVYYGAHLPLDVLGGAGVGILCGVAASVAFGTGRPGRPASAE